MLTNHINSTQITNFSAIRPGDLIRPNAHHVIIITEVGLNKEGQANYFCYAQSSCMYGPESGVRTGYASIKDPKGSLLDQEWFDEYSESIVEQLIAEGGKDSRIVRLKALNM